MTEYLAWQAGIVNEYRRPDQFITTCFSGGIHTNLDQWAIARNLDIVAVNPYFETQDRLEARGSSLTSVPNYRQVPKRSGRLSSFTPQGITKIDADRCAPRVRSRDALEQTSRNGVCTTPKKLLSSRPRPSDRGLPGGCA